MKGKKTHGYTAGLSCSIFDDSPIQSPIENTTSLLSPVSEVLESSSQKPQASLTRTACASALTRIEGVDFLAYGEGLDQTQPSELLPELVFACIWLTGCCF